MARGVTRENFIQQQDRMDAMAESSHLGYLGLTGPNRRTSVLVDSILNTFAVDNEKQGKKLSPGQTKSGPSLICRRDILLNSVPARFRQMDSKRPRFDHIVDQVVPQLNQSSPLRSFKTAARTVIKKA